MNPFATGISEMQHTALHWSGFFGTGSHTDVDRNERRLWRTEELVDDFITSCEFSESQKYFRSLGNSMEYQYIDVNLHLEMDLNFSRISDFGSFASANSRLDSICMEIFNFYNYNYWFCYHWSKFPESRWNQISNYQKIIKWISVGLALNGCSCSSARRWRSVFTSFSLDVGVKSFNNFLIIWNLVPAGFRKFESMITKSIII